MEKLSAGYVCKIALVDGTATVLLRVLPGESLTGYGVATDGDVAVVRCNASGEVASHFMVGGTKVTHGDEALR